MCQCFEMHISIARIPIHTEKWVIFGVCVRFPPVHFTIDIICNRFKYLFLWCVKITSGNASRCDTMSKNKWSACFPLTLIIHIRNDSVASRWLIYHLFFIFHFKRLTILCSFRSPFLFLYIFSECVFVFLFSLLDAVGDIRFMHRIYLILDEANLWHSCAPKWNMLRYGSFTSTCVCVCACVN